MRIQLILFLLVSTTFGQDSPGYLGVSLSPLNDEYRVAYHVPADVREGALITQVTDGSAAAKAGFRSGDVITAFNGKPVRNMDEMVAAIQGRPAGARCTYTLRRGTGTIEGTLKLGARAGEKAPEPPPPPPMEPKPIEPKRKKAPQGLDGRLDELEETVKRLRARAAEKAAEGGKRRARTPRGIDGWIHREERGLEAARKGGNEKEIAFHEIRLGLLRELKKANVGGAPRGRMDRIEKKLDEILAQLRK